MKKQPIEKTEEEKKEELEEIPTQEAAKGKDLEKLIKTHAHSGVDTSIIDSKVIRRKWNSAVSAYPSGSQDVATSTVTRIDFGSEDYDLGGEFATNTFTVSYEGYYFIHSTIKIMGAAAAFIIYIYKNGAVVRERIEINPSASSLSLSISAVLKLNKGDTIDIRVWQNSGNTGEVSSDSDNSHLDIYKIY